MTPNVPSDTPYADVTWSPLRYWRVPVVASPIAQRDLNLLFSVLRAQATGLLFLTFLTLLISPNTTTSESVVAVSALSLSGVPVLFAMWISHRGYVHLGGYIAIFTAVASTYAMTLLFGGLRSSMVLTLVLGPLVASILRGRRVMLLIGGLVLCLVLVSSWLESLQLAPLVSSVDPTGSVIPSAVTTAGVLIIFIAVMFVYSREFERASAAEVQAGNRAIASEKQLADLVRESPDGIAVIDKNSILLSANAAFEQMSGYAENELIGQHILETHCTPDSETKSRLKKSLAQAESTPVLSELTLVRKNGQPYVVETNTRKLVLANGDTAIQIVVRDITERAEAEEKRRSLELDLQDARRMEGLGRLAGGLAHDLRNLLTPVLMNVDGLRDDSKISASSHQMVDEIETAGTRASELLNQIMTFARRQQLDVAVVDVNQEIRSLEPMLRRLIPSDIEIAFHIEEKLRHIRADRGQLSQVIVNLVANARDAMPRGGRLTLETQHVEISEVSAINRRINPGKYSCLIISDTGMGMDEEVRKHIFDPFFTTKGSEEGVGLGLATVHGIVSQSHGVIEVKSEPNRGTAFHIYLPVAEDEQPASSKKSLQSGSNSNPVQRDFQLLVVDDEDLVRTTLERVLRRAGMKVLAASGAKKAISVAREFNGTIDLLITDVVMPEVAGTELALELKSMRPDLKVLFLSGYAGEARGRSDLLKEGAFLLPKPFQPSQLLSRVNSILNAEKV